MDRKMAVVAGATLALALAAGVAAQDPGTGGPAAWQVMVLPQTEAIAALTTGVAVGPDSIVALGQRACERRGKWDIGRCWGQPWVSTDGVSWAAIEARTSGLDLGRHLMATSGPEMGLEGVAYGPGGFVAFGWARPADALNARDAWIAPALWRSDDGRAWERIPNPESFKGDSLMLAGPWLHDIAGSEAGYLLVGTIYGGPAPRAAIWSSPDGLDWTLAEDDRTFDVGAYIDTMEVPAAGGISAVTVPPGATDFTGAMAVGSACPTRESGAGPKGGDWRKRYDWTTGNCWAQYWRTDDGISWQASTFRASDGAPLSSEVYRANAVAASAGGAISGVDGAEAGRFEKLVLHTEDSATWGVASGTRVGRQKAMTTDGTRFHVFVPECTTDKCRRRTLIQWTSADGATWELADAQPTMPNGVEDFIEVNAVPFGDRIVVIAGYWTAPRGDLASMVLASPPLTLPEGGTSGVTAEPSTVSDDDATAGGPETPVITLPPAAAVPEAISAPTGASVAWVAGADTGAPAIHVTDVGGEDDSGPLFEGEWPSWAPDGQRLAYTCAGSDQQLGSVCISSLEQPARGDVLVKQGWRPRWSPDGSAIAFSRSVIDLGDAWVRSVEGHATSRLPGAQPDWSPTGEWVLVRAMAGADEVGTSDLTVAAAAVRPDGSDQRVLRSGWNATWSPDGTKVASTWSDDEVTTVLATDVATGAAEELFALDESILSMAWPTDDTVVVVTEDTRDGNLYAIDLRGETATSLTPGLTVLPHQQLAVSPDGQWLAFAASADERGTDIYVASLDGGWLQLTANGHASSPAWRPQVVRAV